MIKCAECQCAPLDCTNDKAMRRCANCTKDICCCIGIHNSDQKKEDNKVFTFFRNVKTLYAAALGIEILCISAAEIGENSSFALFGYKTAIGIMLGYVIGFSLSTFTTFATILGRYNYDKSENTLCSCCSVLEQDNTEGFLANLLTTLKNFGTGVKKMLQLYKQPNLKTILRASMIILVTAETGCILTAETVDLIFYKHSLFLSIPLALLAGAFTVVAPEAYKKTKRKNQRNSLINNNISFKKN